MSKSDSEKISIEILAKLLDVKSVNEEDTLIFKESNISHAKLCRAFEYWIDQTKTIFGEPVTLYQNQSLRDAGVDVSMSLITSKINFGFQIKSYGDVKERDFSNKVNAQINQSHRHNLNKLVVAIAGNLTDRTQSEKIRGLISEINQQDDNYVIIIPPEKVLTIYNAYVAKQHPLKFVMLEFSDAIKITKGLSASLSNEKREVSVSIDIKYKHTVDPAKYKKVARFTLQLKDEDLSLLDNIEKLHHTGGSLTIPEDKLKGLKIFDGDKLLNEFEKGSLTIIPEYRKKLTIRVLSESGEEINKLEDLSLVFRRLKDEISAESDDQEQHAFRLKLNFKLPNQLSMTFGFEFANNDVEQIQKSAEFVNALKIGKKINFVDPSENLNDILEIPDPSNILPINEHFLRINKSLVTIGKHIGHKFTFPEKLTREEINDIYDVANSLEVGRISLSNVKFGLDKKDAIQLLTHLKTKNDEKLVLNETYVILEKEINFEFMLDLDKFKTKSNIDELIDAATKTSENVIMIELEPIDKEPNTTCTLKHDEPTQENADKTDVES